MVGARVLAGRAGRGSDEDRGELGGRVSAETRRLLPVLLPVALAGLCVVGAALASVAATPPAVDTVAGVAALLAAALFAEVFPVPVENLPGGRLSLAAVFVVSAAILHGWESAVVVAVGTRVTLELLQRRPTVKLVYNGAVYGLAAAAAGGAAAPFAAHDTNGLLVLEVLAASLAFYVVDIPLVATILARWSRQPFLPILRASFLWTAVTFAIMASVSLALVVLWRQSPLLALALAGPLVAVALHQRSTHEALRAMRLALTDPLTGLGNHRHFQDQLQLHLEQAAAERTPVGVCLFDLDNFKEINDRYGHPEGDEVLVRVAAELRRHGQAFRLGGDEFALVLPEVDADGAVERARQAIDALARVDHDRPEPVTLSAGIAAFPAHGDDRSSLVRVADVALYWAKGEGKNRACVYRPDMPAATQLRRLTRASDRAARLQAAAALAGAIDARNSFEGEHSARVAELAAATAVQLGLSRDDVELVRLAGRLHDVGKLAVSEGILNKPDALTLEERAVLDGHPQIGFGMLAPLDIEPVASFVLHHHERFDGSGHPDGLAGEAIPLGARIVFAADAWDTITSVRPYKSARSADDAREELLRCAGTQFDPAVVDALLAAIGADAAVAPVEVSSAP